MGWSSKQNYSPALEKHGIGKTCLNMFEHVWTNVLMFMFTWACPIRRGFSIAMFDCQRVIPCPEWSSVLWPQKAKSKQLSYSTSNKRRPVSRKPPWQAGGSFRSSYKVPFKSSELLTAPSSHKVSCLLRPLVSFGRQIFSSFLAYQPPNQFAKHTLDTFRPKSC